MSRHRHSKKARGNAGAVGKNGPENALPEDSLYGRKSLRRTAVRAVVLVFLLPIFLLLIIGGIGLYLFQGQEVSHSTIDNQVHTSLQAVLGDDYRIKIGKTGLSLISTSIVSLNGKQVQIFKSANGKRIALLDEVKIGIDPVSIFSGKPRFDQLSIEGGTLDVTQMGEGGKPAQMKHLLDGVGKQMIGASRAFSRDTIDQVRINGLIIDGVKYGQRDANNNRLTVTRALVEPDLSGGFSINAELATKFSNFTLGASWQKGDNADGYSLLAGLGPLSSREWFAPADPLAALAEGDTSGFGLATSLRADIRVSFDEALKPDAPYLKLQAEGGDLRLGKGQTIPVGFVVANLRSNLAMDEVTLERAEISLGDLAFEAAGVISTASSGATTEVTSSTPWNLVADFRKFSSASLLWNGATDDADVKIEGVFVPGSKTLDIKSLNLQDGPQSSLSAQAVLQFEPGTSPAVSGNAESASISVRTLQKFWPFHVAPKFRTWLQTRLTGGNAANLDVAFSFAQGRLKETAQGIGFRKEEFSLQADLSDLSMETFGGLPKLQGANGQLIMRGSSINVAANSGYLDPPGKGRVSTANVDLAIADVFKPPALAELKAQLTGSVAALASLANSEPLKVADKIAVNPATLTGEAKADIGVAFLLSGKQPEKDVKWLADIDLVNAGSSETIFGQNITNADISIAANPTLIKAKGKANIGGFDATLDLAEPINGGPSSKRFRNISTKLDNKALAGQGIDVSTVLNGNFAVTINTDANNNDRYEIDLKNADVKLPWISWLKGKGIPAKAAFVLTQKDGVNTLSDFSFSGPTFKAAGRLAFNNSGLISASLKNVVLVRGDQFDVDVTRKGSRFVIAANGRSFDGRSIINKVIHEDGIGGTASNSDVTLTANFGRLSGFNSQVMENLLVRYQTDQGQLTNLEVRGALGGKLSKIDADRSGGMTTFIFSSHNAGSALAVVDLYRKMESGRMSARLVRNGDGPFIGNVIIKDFVVAGEERLKSLVAAPVSDSRLERASGKLRELDVQRVMFDDMKASIRKAENYFAVEDGRLRNAQIGLTFDGTIYDTNEQMSVRGTFMPLFAISRLIGEIPIIGDIFSNGRNSGLIGITYRLKGAADNPTILVNPVSIIAPGIFKDIFQFQR